MYTKEFLIVGKIDLYRDILTRKLNQIVANFPKSMALFITVNLFVYLFVCLFIDNSR